jgi:hypothetical protein
MPVSQQQILQECLVDGSRPRECRWCPANSDKGGKCCYGTFEDDHDSCQDCVQNEDCEYDTRVEASRKTSRPQRTGRVVNTGRSARSRSTSPRLKIYGRSRGSNESLLEEKPRDLPSKTTDSGPEPFIIPAKRDGGWKGFFKEMGLHALWGAGEGALELLTNYLRRRRPD